MSPTPSPSKQDLINSQATSEAPNSIQRLTAYDENNLAAYIGFAAYGMAQSAPVWTIYKFTYNENLLEESKQTALQVAWTDRETAEYA